MDEGVFKPSAGGSLPSERHKLTGIIPGRMKPLVKQLLQASVVIWNCSLKTSIVYFTFMRALYHSHLDIRCPTKRFLKILKRYKIWPLATVHCLALPPIQGMAKPDH